MFLPHEVTQGCKIMTVHCLWNISYEPQSIDTKCLATNPIYMMQLGHLILNAVSFAIVEFQNGGGEYNKF